MTNKSMEYDEALSLIEADRIKNKRKRLLRNIKKYRPFYFLFLPVFVLYLLFNYIPMIGIGISFFDWGMFGPVEFVGLQNFKDIFSSSMFWKAFRNTLVLSFSNLFIGMFFSVGLALLMNEIGRLRFKKLVQTVLYLPHFLSWVVVASIFYLILSPQGGIVNEFIKLLGGDPVYFMISEDWWTFIFLFVNRWKETGWGTIIFMAALTNVDPELYEASSIDGATRLKQTWHITLPAIQNVILVVFILNVAKVLNVFEPVLVMYNPIVYDISDVIGTYTYRMGLLNQNYGPATAVGLFKSVVSLVLVIFSNKMSKRIKGEGIL